MSQIKIYVTYLKIVFRFLIINVLCFQCFVACWEANHKFIKLFSDKRLFIRKFICQKRTILYYEFASSWIPFESRR